MKSAVNELTAFISERAVKFESLQKLADEIDMTLSALLRGMKVGTLSTENCLRLAEVFAEDPSRVLEIARKGDVAELIERLYGKGQRLEFDAPDRSLLEEWAGLSPRARTALRSLIADLQTKKTKRRGVA